MINKSQKTKKNYAREGDKTSWGNEAIWYSNLLENDKDSYQKNVILPNLLRIADFNNNDSVLEIACGSGYFTNEFSKKVKSVTGIDISPELIDLAKSKNTKVKYLVSDAQDIKVLSNNSFDKIFIILAIQNISNLLGVCKEASRLMKDGGQLFIVLNHPSFRIPKYSSWGYDEKGDWQYRRVDQYMTESKEKIAMHPGTDNKSFTTSFHRPIQSYFKALRNSGFVVLQLEEWISHKKSQKGSRKIAEDKSRKEIPMFMCLSAKKI